MKSVIGNTTLYTGDALAVLRTLPSDSVRCCISSPPYWGLRDYGHSGQIGLERTPAEFIAKLVDVFREVRRVLTNDGTCWVNMGDAYNAYNGNRGKSKGPNKNHLEVQPRLPTGYGLSCASTKAKDLIGIPWMLAFALRDDGWYLRQDIIWAKPNPMPESVKDRCTKAHEYLFLLSKSRRYYFNAAAIAEPCVEATIERISQPNYENQEGSYRVPGETNGPMKAVVKKSGNKARKNYQHAFASQFRGHPTDKRHVDGKVQPRDAYDLANKRSVWTIPTQAFKEAHFATFPRKLVEPCILAGSEKGDTVLDPFAGTSTVGDVCEFWDRKFIGIELNPEYVKISVNRLKKGREMFIGGDSINPT